MDLIIPRRSSYCPNFATAPVVCIVEVNPEGFCFTDDFAWHEQVDFARASSRCSFSAALVQVNVAGVNTEAVEEVSPKLLVMA